MNDLHTTGAFQDEDPDEDDPDFPLQWDDDQDEFPSDFGDSEDEDEDSEGEAYPPTDALEQTRRTNDVDSYEDEDRRTQAHVQNRAYYRDCSCATESHILSGIGIACGVYLHR